MTSAFKNRLITSGYTCETKTNVLTLGYLYFACLCCLHFLRFFNVFMFSIFNVCLLKLVSQLLFYVWWNWFHSLFTAKTIVGSGFTAYLKPDNNNNKTNNYLRKNKN